MAICTEAGSYEIAEDMIALLENQCLGLPMQEPLIHTGVETLFVARKSDGARAESIRPCRSSVSSYGNPRCRKAPMPRRTIGSVPAKLSTSILPTLRPARPRLTCRRKSTFLAQARRRPRKQSPSARVRAVLVAL